MYTTPSAPSALQPDSNPKELFTRIKKNLIRNSALLPDSRKIVLVKEVIQLADELAAELFWPTVQDAHAAENISPADFIDGLYLPTCTKNGKPLLEDPLPDEARDDPYGYARDHWNIRMWARYMLYGGGRYLTLDNGWVTFADDQDSVFRYFGIRPAYTMDTRRRLTSVLSNELDLICKGYNVLIYADPDRACYNPANLETQIHLPFLTDYVYALQTVIKTFVTGENKLRSKNIVRHWNVTYKSNEQKTRMVEQFYQKLGVTLYRLSDLIAYINAGASLPTAAPVSLPDLRPDQITQQTLPAAGTDSVKQLLKSAGIAVNAEGYLAVQGNVYLFAATLQHAWTDEQQQAGTGKNKLHQWRSVSQKKRLDYAPLTAEQTEEAFDRLYAIQQRLPTVFAQALHAAHQAAVPPISAAEFYRRLGVPTEVKFDDSGKPMKMFILHPSAWEPGLISDEPMDYYNKLDAQAVCKYLFFGGARNLNRKGPPCYADDSDAFFNYFGLPYGYNDARTLTGHYASVLKSMLGQRNTLFHPTLENKKLLTADLLEEYLTLCGQLLRPLCGKAWNGQDRANTLMQFIDDVFAKLKSTGVFAYTTDSIMDALNLSECGDRFEQLLTDAGLKVENHTILPPAPWDDFQKLLRDAWTIYEINPSLGVQQLKSQLDHSADDETPAAAAAEPAPAPEAAPVPPAAPMPVPASVPVMVSVPGASSVPVPMWIPVPQITPNPAHNPQNLLESGMRLLSDDSPAEDRLRGFSQVMDAAKMGYAPAQVQLGRCYEKNTGIGKMDWGKAFEWYQKAADQNDPDGCFHTGRCHEFGIGTEKDSHLAAMYYAKSMDRLPIARSYMAWCFVMGEGIAKNQQKGIDMLQELAAQQEPSAQNVLGLCYENGYGTPRNYNTALQWYQKSADAGYSSGQYNLGRCYRHGYGVDIDTAKAERLSREAALAGNTSAIVQLARWFADDTLAQLTSRSRRPGFDPHLERMLENLAGQNHTAAQVALGGLYILDAMWCKVVNRTSSRMYGVGGKHLFMYRPDERKLKQAFAWCSAAAETANRRARLYTARCLAFGFGTEADPDRAIALLTEEADRNNTAVMCELAEYLLERHRNAMGDRLRWPTYSAAAQSADSYVRTIIHLSPRHRLAPTRYNYPSIPDEAFGWYYIAGSKGNRKAIEWLFGYYTGTQAESCDHNDTTYWLEAVNWGCKAAENGVRYAQEWLFRYYAGKLTNGMMPVNMVRFAEGFSKLRTPDWAQAHSWAQKLAESGNAEDLFRLAELNNGSNPACRFLKPEEVFLLYQRVQKATYMEDYRLASEDEGNYEWMQGRAVMGLANCHANGFGTPVNVDEAFRLYIQLWGTYHKSTDELCSLWMDPLEQMIRLCEEGRGSAAHHKQAMQCLTDSIADPGCAGPQRIGTMKYLLAKRHLRGGRMIPGTSFLLRLGNPPADDGLPLKPDYKKAVQLLKEAQAHCPEAKALLSTLQG